VKRGSGWWRRAPLAIVLVAVAVLAERTHLRGIGWGDDFALYARQARSVFDGDVSRVIIDNRFNVDNAARSGFSPYVYPWAWPVVLSPFVRVWGLDWDRLAYVSVACFAGFLLCFHAVTVRRIGRWPALALVAFIGTTLAYLTHTASILSELPFMLAAAGTLWWIDRCRAGERLLVDADRRDLVVLGLLAALVFNVRREGLAMLVAIACVQAVELLQARRRPARSVAVPHVTFVAAAAVFQLLLPSALAPTYDDAGLHQLWNKLSRSIRVSFVDQLGFPDLSTAWLRAMLVLVAIGVAVRLWRHAADDIALVVFPALTLVIAGLMPADSVRYTMAVTPFAVYFAAQALIAIPRVGEELALAALVAVTVLHVQDVVPAIRETAEFNDAGGIVPGPETAESQELWAAIRERTHEDDVIGIFKARVLTLYTDRRGVQSSDVSIIDRRADYAVTARGANMGIGEIEVTSGEAADLGWIEVWRGERWVLWRIGENEGP
jgi:hypothetical protein